MSGDIRTIRDVAPSWRVPRPPDAPNIICVVLDDTGWSDFGCFGSEVRTPHIDALAAGGLRYNNFHVTPLCSPTRACLLTGRNHHAVGMRFLADVDAGYDNSRGQVHKDLATIPAMLRSRGYGTYLAGKWHLTPYHELTAAGPFDNWPLAKGFDRFYGILDGCTDQYTPELYQDNQQVERSFPPGYHFSADIVDKAIGWLTGHCSFRQTDPFYLQLAFGATHAPLQVPSEYVEKYCEIFEKGWDVTREDRLRRQIDMGLVPATTKLTPRPDDVPAWTDLDANQQRLFVGQQALYAGFLEHTDEQIGRLLSALSDLAMRDNTLVMVFSDNGAVLEGGPVGAANTIWHFGGFPQDVPEQLDHLPEMGSADWPAHYSKGWGVASNTPFRRFKQFVDLGGVRSPLVVSWPKGISPELRGSVDDLFVHIIDVAATVAELGACDGGGLHGASIAGGFDMRARPKGRRTQYWEMMGRRAIWSNGWRAVAEHLPGTPYSDDVWTLYDMRTDFSECDNLADKQPEMLEELKEHWRSEAEAFGVFPLDDRSFLELLRYRSPRAFRERYVLKHGAGHIPIASGICGTDRPMLVTARLTPGAGVGEGVILSSGNQLGGYVLYVMNGILTFEYVCRGRRERWSDAGQVPSGTIRVGFRLDRVGSGARIAIFVGDSTRGTLDLLLVSHSLSYWGLDVGRCGSTAVSKSAGAANSYTGGGLIEVEFNFAQGDVTDRWTGRE